MALAQRQPLYTVEDYLRIERETDERHEYLDGEIYAMAGESLEHGDISVNVVAELRTQLRGTPCRALTKDTKIRSGSLPQRPRSTKGLFSYPDIVVICGQPQYLDEYLDVILNPTIIIEVLSESTANFDRGEKLQRYQAWNPTLTDYVLISQDKPRVEHYLRREEGGWLYFIYEGLESELVLESINCRLQFADVYDRVDFPITDELSDE